MVEIGRVVVANHTQYEMLHTVRCNIPLPDLTINANSQLPLTVIDPFNDLDDYRIDWRPVGVRYPSGYLKTIQVVFVVSLAAGINVTELDAPYYGGDYLIPGEPREFVITDDAATVIPNLDVLAGTGLHLALQPASIGGYLNFSANAKVEGKPGPIGSQPTTPPVLLEQLLGLFGGYHGSSRDQNGVFNTGVNLIGPEILEKSGQVELWRITSRVYPELQGGNASDYPSLYMTGYFQFSHNQRYVECWLTLGSGLITKDGSHQTQSVETSKRLLNLDFEVTDDVTIEITGPSVIGLWEDSTMEVSNAVYDSIAKKWNSIFTIASSTAPVGNPFNQAWVDKSSLPANGHFPVIRFKLWFGADQVSNIAETVLEVSTRDALTASLTADGSIVTPTPIAANWRAQAQAYGPYGALAAPPGIETGLPDPLQIGGSEATALVAANNLYESMIRESRYHSRLFYDNPNNFGFSSNGRDSAAQPTFHTKYWPIATTGSPDYRSALVEVYKQGLRGSSYVYWDGKPLDHTRHTELTEYQRTQGYGFARETDLAFYSGRPFADSRYATRKFDCLGQLDRDNLVQPRNGFPSVSGSDWSPQDNEHCVVDWIYYLWLLSGDVWLHYQHMPLTESWALAHLPTREGMDSPGVARPRSFSDGIWAYAPSLWHYGRTPRAEARVLSAKAIMFYFRASRPLLENLLVRKENIWLRDEPERFHPDFFSDPRQVETGLFLTKELACAKPYPESFQPVLRLPTGQTAPTWSVWQEAMLPRYMQRFHLALRETFTSDLGVIAGKTIESHTTELQDMIYTLSRAYVLHGMRKYRFSLQDEWITIGAIDWVWDPNNAGRALDMSNPQMTGQPPWGVTNASGFSGNNPLTGRPYAAHVDGFFRPGWNTAVCIQAYNEALLRGDTATRNKAANTLLRADNGINPTEDLSSSGRYGWGGRLNNIVEYGMVETDAWRQDRATINFFNLRFVNESLQFEEVGTKRVGASEVLEFSNQATDFDHQTELGALILFGSTGGITKIEFFNVSMQFEEFLGPQPFIPLEILAFANGEMQFTFPSLPTVSVIILNADLNFNNVGMTFEGQRVTLLDLGGFRISTPDILLQGEAIRETHYQARDDMTLRNRNLTLHAGNARKLVVTVFAGLQDTDPWDNSEVVAASWILKNSSTGKILSSKSLDNGIDLIGAATIWIHLLDSDTVGLSGIFYQEFSVTTLTGPVTLLTGQVTIPATEIS